MLTSICRSIVTICSALYLLIGMTSFSSKWIVSPSTWYKKRRSGHAPCRDLPSSIEQILKPAHCQTLVPKPPMKAFYVCVLRRLSRLNVHQFDLSLHAPRQKMPTCKFGPVVAADRSRLSPLRYDRIQHSRYSSAGKTGVHFQSQALACVRIHYAQQSHRPP